MTSEHDTIAAPATAAGGAIAVLRVSGTDALTVCDRIFRGRTALREAAPNTILYGRIVEPAALSNRPAALRQTHDPSGESLSPHLRSPHDQSSAPPSAYVAAGENGAGTGPRQNETSATADTGNSGETSADDFCDRITEGSADTLAQRGSTNPVNSSEIDSSTDTDDPAALDGTERTIDDVLAAVFRAPHSYTGEDSVEISCHGSTYVVSEILRLLIASGARTAQPGEFTTRAFLAGKMDLAQAEAVADLIASSSRTAHALASTQMRGGYSSALRALRGRLVELMSLLELELDFSEEDVEFADRTQLRDTMCRIGTEIEALRNSFSLGNALKRGVAVAIVGAPNVGKSTLLNRLLGEERAMVSEIAGTTRDAIEETMDIDGVLFRFIDTAGIRATDDRLERMGIERTRAAIARAQIVIRMIDAESMLHTAPPTRSERTSCRMQPQEPTAGQIGITIASPLGDEMQRTRRQAEPSIDPYPSDRTAGLTNAPESSIHMVSDWNEIRSKEHIDEFASISEMDFSSALSDRKSPSALSSDMRPTRRTINVINKIDKVPHHPLLTDAIAISAREGTGIDRLRQALRRAVDTDTLYHGDPVVSSARHYEALTSAHMALGRALAGIDGSLPSDLLGEELRSVLYHLGTITGEITSDEILGTIFSKFCIGK